MTRYVIQFIIVAIVFAFFMLSSVKGAEVDQVQIPYPAVLACWGIDKAVKTDTYMGDVKGTPFFVMGIDTNKDGKKDGMLLFPVLRVDGEASMDISTEPAYIILDTDYDGQPDKAWFDKGGGCKDLVPVPLNYLLSDYKGA